MAHSERTNMQGRSWKNAQTPGTLVDDLGGLDGHDVHGLDQLVAGHLHAHRPQSLGALVCALSNRTAGVRLVPCAAMCGKKKKREINAMFLTKQRCMAHGATRTAGHLPRLRPSPSLNALYAPLSSSQRSCSFR